MEDNAIRVTEKLGGMRVVVTGGSGGGEEKDPIWIKDKPNYYDKSQVYKKDEVYSKNGVDERVNARVLTVDFEASQKIQDDRLDVLEKGGGTPIDVYNKVEIDEMQAKQDVEINKKINATNVYNRTESDEVLDKNIRYNDNTFEKKADITTKLANYYNKSEIDQSQATQDARIEALENSGGGVEQDPKWTADKPNYRTKTDQDTIDNGINQAIGTMSMDVQNLKSTKVDKLDFNTSQDAQNTEINALKARLTVPAKATAVSKVVDNVTSNTNNLTFEASPKFYANNGVFTNTNGVITNTVTTDATNNIYIKGSVQLIMAGLISAITTVTISCSDDINGITKVRQFTISSESAFAIPFEFIIPGNKATTNITVTFSGLSGLTSRKIMPTYVTFEKLK